jgi:hypothetical protein
MPWSRVGIEEATELDELVMRIGSTALQKTYREYNMDLKLVPRELGCRAVIAQLSENYPRWRPCSHTKMLRHAKTRCEGKSPAKCSQQGKQNRKLNDAIEKKMAGVVLDMAEAEQVPSMGEMQKEFQLQLDGTSRALGSRMACHPRATSRNLWSEGRRESRSRWTRPSMTLIAGRNGGIT